MSYPYIDHYSDRRCIFVLNFRLFMSEKYNRSLLILDDVWSVDIIRAFNISARVLVTTRDISILDVVSKQDQTIVEIHTGFTEKESLEVLVKILAYSDK